MMHINAYRDTLNFQNTSSSGFNSLSESKNTYNTFNIDLGVAAIFAEHYRVGLTIKDAAAKDFNLKQDTDTVTGIATPDLKVKLRPRSRLGVGYVNSTLSIGLDYDIQKNTPMASEAPSQLLSIGMEYTLFDTLALRAGYKQDQIGTLSNVTSAGVGYRWHRVVADISYSQSSEVKGAGLQLGWTF